MPSMEGGDPDQSIAGMMYPLMYMHNVYSNMVDKVTQHMSVSWSFFMQDGTGRLVVIKSHPQVVDLDVQDFDDYSTFKGTSSGVETNIEASDNTATEMLRHSQMKSVRSFGDEMNAARAYPWSSTEDSNNSDWLSCIARKTGIPRLLLCIIILLSAIAMIWLCMSAAVTAPAFILNYIIIFFGLQIKQESPYLLCFLLVLLYFGSNVRNFTDQDKDWKLW
ncbi:transmembrane protein 59-like [Aplysia californica]|uniref:Transmembrane protein 59-like n=1 Tax=Aplysia californica TaxID=6500 RepID=A0ABM0K3E7_APLCA|nr:transmembrane protein 59-like [Aplysia californica]